MMHFSCSKNILFFFIFSIFFRISGLQEGTEKSSLRVRRRVTSRTLKAPRGGDKITGSGFHGKEEAEHLPAQHPLDNHDRGEEEHHNPPVDEKHMDSTYLMGEEVLGFEIGEKIGKGSFGEVRIGKDKKTGLMVALKIDPKADRETYTNKEVLMLQALQSDEGDQVGIPRYYGHGKTKDGRRLSTTRPTRAALEVCRFVVALELLGKAVASLFFENRAHFSLKTLLLLADEMLQRVEYIHRRGFIHRDIKPGNFVMGVGPSKDICYAIDYGLSRPYMKRNGAHISEPRPDSWQERLVGTARYASRYTHWGLGTRRDDMEGLAYVWIYLFKGGLPWMKFNDKDKKARYHKIRLMKFENNIVEELTKDMPEEFYRYLAYSRALKYSEKPDYASLRQMFKSLYVRLEYPLAHPWPYDFYVSRRQKRREDLDPFRDGVDSFLEEKQVTLVPKENREMEPQKWAEGLWTYFG